MRQCSNIISISFLRLSVLFALFIFPSLKMDIKAQTDSLYLHLDSVTFVSSKHTSLLNVSSAGKMDVDMDLLQKLPKILGNSDPVRFIRLLPAVQTNSECDSGVHIQGCDNAHNDISLGGVPVYGANHMLGIFSVFNPSHYVGMSYAEVSQSNRLGGMVMMNLPDTLKKEVTGDVHLSFMVSQGSLGFRSGRNSHFRVSARVSYLNLLYSNWLKMLDSDIKYGLSDYNFTYIYAPSEYDRVWVDVYCGDDRVSFDEHSFNMYISADWGNLTGAVHWEHSGERLWHKHTTFFSGYMSDVDVIQDDIVAKMPSYIMSAGYKGSVRWRHLTSSADVTLYETMPQSPKIDGGLIAGSDIAEVQKGLEASLTMRYSRPLTDRLTLDASLKGTFFSTPGTKPYWGVLPDVALTYNLYRAGKIAAGYGWRRQHIFQTGLTNIGLPVEFWILSGKYGDPQNSQYANLSYDVNLLGETLSLSVGTFGKILYNQIEYKGDLLDLLLSEYDLESNLLKGEGWNYGVNFMLQKQSGDFTGWINYSLGRALRRFDNHEYTGLYPANHERIHDLNIVGSYKSGKWDYSGTFVFASGLPFTAPRSLYLSSGQIMIEYGEHNARRMRPYLRLDVSVNYTVSKGKHGENGINFSMYNVLGRKNDIMYKLFMSDESFRISHGSIPLVFMPSVSYYHKF